MDVSVEDQQWVYFTNLIYNKQFLADVYSTHLVPRYTYELFRNIAYQ